MKCDKLPERFVVLSNPTQKALHENVSMYLTIFMVTPNFRISGS